MKIIEKDTFHGCSSLTEIVIPDNVTSIGSQAFYNCVSLRSLKLSKSLKTIDSYAFSNCNLLTSLTIPDSVTSIGNGAFGGCNALREVKSLALVPPTLYNQSCFSVYDQARLVVPQAALAAYNTAQYWSLFNKSIAIEQIGDVNGDGNMTIADVTSLIDLLVSDDELPDGADVNGDGVVSIKDVTDLIDILLSGN